MALVRMDRKGLQMRARSRPRPGFTLIELLVLIAIGGVCVGLLLPAIHKVRGASSRSVCVNNLKQINLATHQFAVAHGDDLPPVTGPYPRGSLNTGTIFYYLLPFIEQDDLYQNSASPNGEFSASNRVMGAHPPLRAYGYAIATYLCPCDPSAPPGHHRFGGLATQATANYAANARVFVPGATQSGTYASGSSNTIAYVEHYQVCDGQWFYWGLSPFPLTKPPSYEAPVSGEPFQIAPPRCGGECDASRPSTPHPGGMPVGVGDGSVRVLGRNLSLATFQLASDPSSRAPLGPDWTE
jgi:prepilin-type N-terminal cleavage/methylation domain-containing protein